MAVSSPPGSWVCLIGLTEAPSSASEARAALFLASRALGISSGLSLPGEVPSTGAGTSFSSRMEGT
jgi:hypothetical protein